VRGAPLSGYHQYRETQRLNGMSVPATEWGDSELPRIVDLEIQLDRTGLSDQEIDERTRRLAEQLREFPQQICRYRQQTNI
jgi:hypothetical protein